MHILFFTVMFLNFLRTIAGDLKSSQSQSHYNQHDTAGIYVVLRNDQNLQPDEVKWNRMVWDVAMDEKKQYA